MLNENWHFVTESFDGRQVSEEEEGAGEGGQNGVPKRIQRPRHRRSVPRQARTSSNKRSANKENVQPSADNKVETIQPLPTKILVEAGDQPVQVFFFFIREQDFVLRKLVPRTKSKILISLSAFFKWFATKIISKSMAEHF